MYRGSLSRKVHASATASTSEAEFVRRARDTGLLLRPRYAKNTTDVVVGYSVAERPKRGERHIWYGGGKLASDLGLGQLRQGWPDTAHGAIEAAAEWNAAARNKRITTKGGPERAEPTPEMWQRYTRNTAELAAKLKTIPLNEHATWAKAAREASGAFAAWSHRLESTPGPLAATSAELARTAQLRQPERNSKPVALPSISGTAMVLLAATSKDKTTAQTAMLIELMRTARAIYEMHQQSGSLRQSQNLHRVLTTQLAPFYQGMPPAQPGTGQRPAAGPPARK